MTSKENPLPSFLIIGSMRAGTTALYSMLNEVDGLCMADMKEVDYFIEEKNYKYGDVWYQKQFKDLTALCGEASPNYTKRDIFKDVPQRVFETNPNVKIIFIARDPVDRCISQYQFSYLSSTDMPSPEEFMASDEGKHILNTSRYAWQIKPWIETFGRDVIMIIDFKSLCQNPEVELKKITDFIGHKTDRDFRNMEQENTSEDVGSIPLWYLRLKETRLGAYIRTIVPRGGVKIIKKLVFGTGKTRTPPKFPTEVIEEIKDALRKDADEFRKISAMEFHDWKI